MQTIIDMDRQDKKITASGNIPRPGQKSPATIILTKPKRFGIDISDYITSVRSAEDVDYSRRFKLYDLYSDILMDTHLTSVIDKRVLAVQASPVEFQRDGKPDKALNEQIESPWFRRLVGDILGARWWGFSLVQFYKEGGWINYDLVPRKHVDPVRRLILRRQTDITGTSWDEYPDLLFIGDKDDLGLLAKAAPWVIYKRNDVADWAQFAEVFGMPIQEYTYETDDDDARRRAIEDAGNAGAMGIFIHGKDSALELKEAGNKTGSADLYDKLCDRCNNEISKLFLGNTLTTESSDRGTQALGTVHKKVEDKIVAADKTYVLDVLNYDMADIFLAMGIDTRGGKFCFPEKEGLDPSKEINVLSQLKRTFNLPISDDYLYQKFGVEKPADYRQLKERQFSSGMARVKKESSNGEKRTGKKSVDSSSNQPEGEDALAKRALSKKGRLSERLKRFFVRAPQGGAVLGW